MSQTTLHCLMGPVQASNTTSADNPFHSFCYSAGCRQAQAGMCCSTNTACTDKNHGLARWIQMSRRCQVTTCNLASIHNHRYT